MIKIMRAPVSHKKPWIFRVGRLSFDITEKERAHINRVLKRKRKP